MRPMVGRIPTSMLAFEGLMTDPPVSVPTLAAHRLAAVPMPELDPPVCSAGRPSNVASLGSGRGSYGLYPNPPTALKLPGIGFGLPATQLASSVRPVFAMMIAPASCRLRVSVAAYGGV